MEQIALDIQEQKKTCPECFVRKSFSSFQKNSNTCDKLHNLCKECCSKQTKKYRSTQDQRERGLKSRYNLSKEDYNKMLSAQNNVCAICGGNDPKSKHGYFVVDHCHASGKVRALLCHNCNAGLGHFRDNISYIEAAIEYLNANRN